MSRYQTDKIDDPRQVDVEEYIREKGGYTPGPRQAVAFGADGKPLNNRTEPTYETTRSMYAPLQLVLQRAFDQAAFGKGRERHANDKPFLQQPIMEITRMHGLGFTTGQAAKKAQEAIGMMLRGEHYAAERELLGAIVYLAAACIHVQEVRDSIGVDDKSQEG